MNTHRLGTEISYPRSPRRQDDATLEGEYHPPRSNPAEGEYLFPIDTTNNYPGTPDQDDLFRRVEPVDLSFGRKLELYRRMKSEEYEKASQRWADCPLEEWLAGPDGEYPEGKVTRG
jgi:hypothetical protein